MVRLTLLEAALNYARNGVAVFPCAPDKAPLTKHGFEDATTDEAQVRRWWKATPDALIGAAIPEGTIIIDIDPRNGGSESIKRLRAEHGTGAFPSTRTAKTGGGGYHRWYAVEPGLRLRGKLAPGVDVKREGKGYIVLPPSRSVLGPYLWQNEHLATAEAPAWLVETLQKPDPTERVAVDRTPPSLFPFQDGTSYGEAALHNEIEKLMQARPGERNDALNLAAFALGQLVGGGELKEEPVRAQLEEAAQELGLEQHEIDLTLDSGLEAGAGEPRNAPEQPDREHPRTTLEMIGDDDYSEEDAEAHFWLDWESGDVEPEQFILRPLLPRGAYVLVYGPSEASKSMVFNAIGAEASRRGFTVSVYSLENPPSVDRQRLRRLEPDPSRFRLSNQLMNLADPGQAHELMERERGRDLVIIDTYSHAYAPRYASDDGNAKAIEFARVIRWLIRKTGATFVVIDHTGFERQEEPRDASAKRQQVDVAIGMQREREWELGKPADFSMENFKSARFANPFRARGQIRGGPEDPLSYTLTLQKGELEWGELR